LFSEDVATSAPIITRVVKGVAKRYIGCPLNKNVTLRGSIVEVWAKLMLPGKISTVRTTLARLNAFIDFLIEGGIVGPSVLARKMRLKVPDSLHRSMDPEDEDRLVSVEGEVAPSLCSNPELWHGIDGRNDSISKKCQNSINCLTAYS